MAKERMCDEPTWMDDEAPRSDNKGPLFVMRERLSNLDLSGRVRKGSILSTHGGYSDVFFGIYKSRDGKTYSVAVKQLRVHIVEERKLQRNLARELYNWSKLDHPNILPFYGFYIEDDIYPNLVAPRMTNGTVTSYLETNPTADVVSLVKGIAEGIRYLHAEEIIHSDIKPDNVLISELGEPRICDFGVSRILESSASFQASTTNTARGTLRYMAKEVILAEDGETHCKEADVWAFGMTVYAIVTKLQPYHHIPVDAAVVFEVCNGKLPSWPEDSESWPLASRRLKLICVWCWLPKSERPTMEDISSRLDILVKEFPAIACLDVMRAQLRFNTFSMESSFLTNAGVPRLESRIKELFSNELQIAGLHWVDYALHTNNVNALRGPVTDFFSSVSALYWIEFLSLIGELKTGKTILQKLSDHFDHQNEDEIVRLAQGWNAFISDFYDAISISAPHVYISALSWGAPSSVKQLAERRLLVSEDNRISDPATTNPEAIDELKRNLWDAWCFSFSPDGSKFASGHFDGSLRIWDAVSCELIRNVKAHHDVIYDVKFSPDGCRIITASKDKTSRIWDAQTGNLVVGPLRGHTYRVWAVECSPDGRTVVSASGDMTARVWDTQSGAVIGEPLIGHVGPVMAVAYSPDSNRIVSASGDNTLRIWSAHTGKQIGEPLRGHSNWIRCAAYSPDGGRIVSGSDDEMVRIWDAQSGAPVGEPLTGHRGSVRSVAYTPDGSKIVSGSLDNTFRIWDARTGEAIGCIPRGESRWDPDRGCFLSILSWWPVSHWTLQRAPLITASLIHSDAPIQIPDDGWLRTLDGDLFLWVPTKYRDDVCCHGAMGKITPRLKLEWKRVPHGKDWRRVKEILEERIDQ